MIIQVMSIWGHLKAGKKEEKLISMVEEITIRIFSSCCIANLATRERERERLVFNAEQIDDMIYLIQAWQ